jgi:hypothetical protein
VGGWCHICVFREAVLFPSSQGWVLSVLKKGMSRGCNLFYLYSFHLSCDISVCLFVCLPRIWDTRLRCIALQCWDNLLIF